MIDSLQHTYTCTYQGEEIGDEISMLSESKEGTATQVLARLEAATVLPSHGIHEVWHHNVGMLRYLYEPCVQSVAMHS